MSTLNRLTGLLHPEASLRVGADAARSGRVSRGATGLRLTGVRRQDRVPPGPPIEELSLCTFDGARVEGAEIVGRALLSSFIGAQLIEPLATAGARLELCRLDGALLQSPALGGMELICCSLRDLEVRGGQLGRLLGCDAVGARLTEVKISGLESSDLSLARLERCDLRGADLRGVCLRRAELRDCRLEGALVEGADLSGVIGLDRATLLQLIEGGARVSGAFAVRLARALRPRASASAQRRLAAAFSAAGWLTAIVGGLGAAALVLTPPPPVEAPALPPPLERVVTPEDRLGTQAALKELREALGRARADRAAKGATNAQWPSLHELQENRYDLDGDGPSEVMQALLPQGLPDNLLTESRGGVLPYCEEPPSQAALQEVDADWHYCDLNGRLFATAGFTKEATLNW
ncbi:MAG: pentapeptide repeat-containing protein [Deltaproteobacteria bacterium]|nr:pentapeptide repeat-containing protein [Deltaproteobacteria bacterium]